jgi:hypothetical protein
MKFTLQNENYQRYEDEPETWTIEFGSVGVDYYGTWVLYYWCNDSRCCRRIVDKTGKVVKWCQRKPTGGELLDTAKSILGRKLTEEERDHVLNLRVVV